MRKALIVGIDSYSSCPLTGCVNDAKNIAHILEHNEDGSRNYDIMLETSITEKHRLKQRITELFAGNADNALFFFSGHGAMNELGGYIVTPDFKRYDEGVSMSEILALANASKCKNKVIILDCCHSGGMGTVPTMHDNASIIGEGVTVLSACRENEVSVERGGQGIFSQLLVDALAGGASDIMGDITPGGVYSYVDRALGPWDQRPVFKTNITRFTCLRKTNPQIALDDLRQLTELFAYESDSFALDPSFEYTNDPKIEHTLKQPYATDENVRKFKLLQRMQSIGLVKPVDAPYMYFAAMESKACALTTAGRRYWRLVKEKRI